MPAPLTLVIEHDDVTTFDADVVVLKYANGFHGADAAVAGRLGPGAAERVEIGCSAEKPVLVDGVGLMGPRKALFLGVGRLADFRYNAIRKFAAKALGLLATEVPGARHVALTIHGPNYGLDEREALLSLVAGMLDALKRGDASPFLERVTIVDRDRRRVARLREVLAEAMKAEPGVTTEQDVHRIPRGPGATPSTPAAPSAPEQGSAPLSPAAAVSAVSGVSGTSVASAVSSVSAPAEKRHVFVAMPFTDEMVDVFYYGIQGPVHRAGFLCERIDHATFVGDIVDQIRRKIDTAAVVVADLTGANANVYLEVGYAWGRGRPVILISKKLEDLQFDVRGQRCLLYSSIKQLEMLLEKDLQDLKVQGAI